MKQRKIKAQKHSVTYTILNSMCIEDILSIAGEYGCGFDCSAGKIVGISW